MDNLFKEKSSRVMRKGDKVNMDELLGELDSLYLADMDATISTYQTYEEVSNETYNDFKVVCASLEMLFLLKYIDAKELLEMRQTAAEMRLKKLEELIDEENKS